MPHKITNCVVVGGGGQVGRLFAGLLASSAVKVTVVDIDHREKDDDTRFTNVLGDVVAPDTHLVKILTKAECVLLAVPEQVALAAVPKLLTLMPRGSLLADTLSVKSRIAALLHANAAGIEAVSLNPMFAPSLTMTGRPVAVVTVVDGLRAQAFLELMASWGGELVRLESAEHDRLVASVQAATHISILAFGLALQELEADVEKLCALAPPPHLTMLALLARITSGEPEVYWDVQAGNPNARVARLALQSGLERLSKAIDGNDLAAFASLLSESRTFLKGEGKDLAQLCADLFEGLPPRLHGTKGP
jgi:prephenate dehydrogenase